MSTRAISDTMRSDGAHRYSFDNTETPSLVMKAHPLSGVLNNRTISLTIERLVIIEWLNEGDEKTGKELFKRMETTGAPVEYISCRSGAEVLVALRAMAQRGRDHRIPIVHIEAHGEEGDNMNPPKGFVGPDGHGGTTLLTWEELGTELRPLNLLTKFNLIVVGAACYGEGLLMGVAAGEPMPFVAAVGYRGAVSTTSLKHAFIEMYRGLLVEGKSLGEAVDAANRQHFFDSDSELRETSSAMLLLESLAESRHAGPVVNREKLSSEERELLEKQGIEFAWKLHFAFDQIPENKRRFEIDIEEMMRSSRAKQEWSE